MFVPFNDLTRIHTPLKKGVIKKFEKIVDKKQFCSQRRYQNI